MNGVTLETRRLNTGWAWSFGLTLLCLLLVPWANQSAWIAYLPLALGVLIFALPHGALDHYVARETLRRRGLTIGWPPILRAYVGIAAAYGLCWLWSPAWSLVFFLILTIYHWGEGDAWFDRRTRSTSVVSGPSRTLHRITAARPARMFHKSSAASPEAGTGADLACSATLQGGARLRRLLARGGPPIAFPFLFHPVETGAVISGTLSLFGPAVAASSAITQWGAWIGVAAGFSYVSELILNARAGRWRAALDLFLLGALFIVAHPVYAIGVYFCFWHGLRHLTRLSVTPPFGEAMVKVNFARALRRLSWLSLPCTLVTLAAILLIAWLTPATALGASGLLGVYLVVLSLVTLPHAIVVEAAEARKSCGRSHRADGDLQYPNHKPKTYHGTT